MGGREEGGDRDEESDIGGRGREEGVGVEGGEEGRVM